VSARSGRTQTCGKPEARTRLAVARAFIDAADLVLDEDDDASLNVAASLAVLAGIAASDAACCSVLGRRARGQDHRDAVALLSGIATAGNEMGKDLARLLDLKDNAQHGVIYISEANARRAVQRAQRIVDTAAAVVTG
jgi:hypothetical protein